MDGSDDAGAGSDGSECLGIGLGATGTVGAGVVIGITGLITGSGLPVRSKTSKIPWRRYWFIV